MKRGGKVMSDAENMVAGPATWQMVRDLRNRVKTLEDNLELTESLRNRDGEYIKILEGARSDAECSLAYSRAELNAERARAKLLDERKTALEVHVEGARAEINAAVIILKIIRGLRPNQGKDKRGIVDKLVSRLEFYAKHLGK